MDTAQITRIARVTAVVAVVAFAVKVAVIAAAGGLDRTFWEEPPFYIGFFGALAALVLTALVASSGRGWRGRLGVVLVMLATAVVIQTVTDLVASAVRPESPGWIWGEVSLWALALTALVLALVLPGRSRPVAHPTHRPA